MADETTFELASIQFGAEPVAVFRFGYERFELRARLGPGNLEHAIAAAAEVAASVFARWSHEALHRGFALARTEGRYIIRRVANDCARRSRPFWRILVTVASPNPCYCRFRQRRSAEGCGHRRWTLD
jgi:hypothetical protein